MGKLGLLLDDLLEHLKCVSAHIPKLDKKDEGLSLFSPRESELSVQQEFHGANVPRSMFVIILKQKHVHREIEDCIDIGKKVRKRASVDVQIVRFVAAIMISRRAFISSSVQVPISHWYLNSIFGCYMVGKM